MAEATALGQMRDQRAAAEQIARQMGIPVGEVLRGLQAQAAAGPSYMDNGNPAEAAAAAQFNPNVTQAHNVAIKGGLYAPPDVWASDALTTAGNNAYARAADLRDAATQNVLSSMSRDYASVGDMINQRNAVLARHERDRNFTRDDLAQQRMDWNSRILNAQVAENRSPLNALSQISQLIDAGLLRRVHDAMAGGRNLPPRPEDVPSVSAPRNF